ncbi:hypothetical protein D3C80_1577480 [compost metagenome]
MIRLPRCHDPPLGQRYRVGLAIGQPPFDIPQAICTQIAQALDFALVNQPAPLLIDITGHDQDSKRRLRAAR